MRQPERADDAPPQLSPEEQRRRVAVDFANWSGHAQYLVRLRDGSIVGLSKELMDAHPNADRELIEVIDPCFNTRYSLLSSERRVFGAPKPPRKERSE